MIITASIVTYKTDHDELKKCIDSMRKNGIAPIYISDNSPSDELREFCSQLDGVEYIFNNANMGYGPGHNVAIKKAQEIHADYHLVINSDVYFDEGIIAKITEYMEANEDVAQLQPMLRYPDGRLQLTTRLLPTPFDLIFRRFMPKKMGEKMNYRYTLEFWFICNFRWSCFRNRKSKTTFSSCTDIENYSLGIVVPVLLKTLSCK